MKSFKGEVKYSGLVSNEDRREFYKQLQETVSNLGELHCEIQYSTQAPANGTLVFTALVIGRSRHDEE
ncbi:hypothetical protein IEO_03083 [Bacillus wiedmannii]|nr:hypothetical protein IEO_03083 [Bacillus wiedmannii]